MFIVVAMKSATTSLHNYFDAHPEMFMAKAPWKEPGYFVTEINAQRGEDWYLSLFADATAQHKYIGESTTDYTKRPNYSGVPERIHAFNPDARIIYIMRDPVERAISHYWWEVAYSTEGRDMLTAIKKVDWITNASNYAMQLEPYMQLFGPDHVYVLTTETLAEQPGDCLRDIFDWLGVDASFQIPEMKRHNESKAVIQQFAGARYFSHLRGGKLWNLMKTIVPREARHKIRTSFTRPVVRNDSHRIETIRYLQPIMRPQVEKLSEMLEGRQFPEWNTLYSEL